MFQVHPQNTYMNIIKLIEKIYNTIIIIYQTFEQIKTKSGIFVRRERYFAFSNSITGGVQQR